MQEKNLYKVPENYRGTREDKKVYDFHTRYRGLEVGESTLNEVVDLLGEPIAIVNQNRNYRFDGVEFTFSGGKGTINTIIIKDEHYIDVNGYKIGTLYNEIVQNPNVQVSGGSGMVLVERSNGVVYWFTNGQVSKIVYGAQLLL
jgi:hypothetical protein